MNARGWAALAVVDQVATVRGATPARVSLAWLIQRPGVTSPIATATTPDHVVTIVGAVNLDLVPKTIARRDCVGR